MSVAVALLAGVLAWNSIASVFAADPPANSEPVRLTRDGIFKQHLAWSPDGKQLLYTAHHSKQNWLMSWTDPDSPARRLSKESAVELTPTWSPDGKRIAYAMFKFAGTQGNMEIMSANPDLSDAKLVSGDQDGKLSHEESPAWSPDGKRIAFVSSADGNAELYLCDPNGNNRLRLTQDTAIDTHPSWSPDSKQIAFATSRWGDLEIAVMNADGTGIRRLTQSRGIDDFPAWSPDGKHIAFTSHRDGNFEVYVMRADGEAQANITRHPEIDNFAAWTPDGKLSFISNRDRKFDAYLLPNWEAIYRQSASTNSPSHR